MLHHKFFQPALLVLGALLSVALMLYPLLSNYLYDQRQDGVVERYQSTVQTASAGNDEMAQALNIARDYNRRLAAGHVRMEDPYASEEEIRYAGTVAELMDRTGTGVIGVVEIPRLGLSLPIYYGTGESQLEQGIGILEYTSLPVGGTGTHSVLCGHSGLSSAELFSDLPMLERGDLFCLYVLGEKLAYEVDQIQTVLPEETEDITVVPGEDLCTLVTCVPFGVNTHRLLVRGHRTSLPVEQEQTEIAVTQSVTGIWEREYLQSLGLGAALLVTMVLIWIVVECVRRRRRAG